CEQATGHVVHLGTGLGVSIRRLAEILQGLTGKRKPIVEVGERKRPEKSEVFQLISSPVRARQLIGWEPSVSLEDGLERVLVFVKEHPEIYESQAYAI